MKDKDGDDDNHDDDGGVRSHPVQRIAVFIFKNDGLEDLEVADRTSLLVDFQTKAMNAGVIAEKAAAWSAIRKAHH